MAGFRYLSPTHLQGFSKYKYNSFDTSPFSNYIMHPFWNATVKLVPMWIAPNVLTFVGFLLLSSILALLSYYDWDYDTTSSSVSDSSMQKGPIPQWVWLYGAVAHFVSYTLDGIDGKQARRTGACSPLGELFDHGLDSWAATIIPLSLFSIFGRGEWGGSPHEGLAPLIALCAGFHTFHWEKYITGALYLPWVFDISQVGVSLAYLATYIFGVELWQFHVYPGINCARVVKWAMVGAYFISLPTTFLNVYKHLTSMRQNHSNSQSQQPQGQHQASKSNGTTSTANNSGPNHLLLHENNATKVTQQSMTTTTKTTTTHGHASDNNIYQTKEDFKTSVFDYVVPGVSFVLMSVLYFVWTQFSPSDIIEREPRVFFFSLGVVYSNMACRLIISQMSNTPAQTFNHLLLPLACAVAVSLAVPAYEVHFLYLYCAIVLLAHLHYGTLVVRELCEHFNIYCFALKRDR